MKIKNKPTLLTLLVIFLFISCKKDLTVQSENSLTAKTQATSASDAVGPLRTNPIITYTTPVIFTVGTAITPLSPTNSGYAATSYSVSPTLPSGLSLNTGTGVISGTPGAASSATNYTITASNVSGIGTFVVNITVQWPVSYITGSGSSNRGTEYDFLVNNYVTGDTFFWAYPSTYLSVIGGKTGSLLSTNLNVTGGTTPVTFTVSCTITHTDRSTSTISYTLTSKYCASCSQ